MKRCPTCDKQYSDDANFCPVDASRLTAAADLVAPVAPLYSAAYDRGRVLAQSVSGEVVELRERNSGRPAMGKLRATRLDTTAEARLDRELATLERLDHPGVVRVLAQGRVEEGRWVVMEMLTQPASLLDVVSRSGALPPHLALAAVIELGQALAAGHQVGILHRAFGPEHVWLAEEGIKVANLGWPVASAPVDVYRAPEVTAGDKPDQRSNIYSLGAVFYYLLTGAPPSPEGWVQKSSETNELLPARIRAGWSNALSSGIETTLQRALARSATARFVTVQQFTDELLRLSAFVSGGQMSTGKNKEIAQTILGFKPAVGPTGTIAGVPVPGGIAQAAASAESPKAEFVASGTQVEPPAPEPKRAATAGSAVANEPVPTPVQSAAAVAAAPVMPDVAAPVEAAPAVAAPVEAAPVVAAPAPVVAAPVVAAPVVAAPAVAAPAVVASGKKAEEKGKFRETMWFKKGELDVAAAEAAAQERARTGKDLVVDKADTLPMDERYKDDGSITRGDKEKYSLRTGATQMMDVAPGAIEASIAAKAAARGASVSEDELIGELKSGSRKLVIGIVAAVVILAIIMVVLFT